MLAKKITIAGILCIGMVAPLQADPLNAMALTPKSTSPQAATPTAACPQTEEPKQKTVCCGPGEKPMRVSIRHIEPNGIGYNQGYTTAEGFFSPYNGWEDWVPFLDARMHVFNDGEPALNAGLGARYLTESRIWGFNVYYDYRKTHRYHYNQITAGLESLGQMWDFRINGYAPVGRWTSPLYGTTFSHFQENYAILRQRYEYALGGFNAEAAAHVDVWEHFPLYFAGGPYYLNGRGSSTWGAQARASVTIYEYLKVEANLSYDHLFKWIGQGQVGLSFSFGGAKETKSKTKNCPGALALSQRAYQSVDRFEIIPVDKRHKYSTAINPATGQPYFFTFVNNLSSSLGTYESPYATLLAAETNSGPYGVIYVFPGDGTTTGMSSGIALQANQKLWGSGVAQTLATTLGKISVPALSNSTSNGIIISPVITYASGAVVTAANGNEISGLYLQNQGANPCISAASVTNLSVLNSNLVASNSTGNIGVSATSLLGTLSVSGCTVNQLTGISLTNSAGSCTVNVSNSTITANTDQGIWLILSSTAEADLSVQNTTISATGNGIEVDLSGTSEIAAQFNNNQILAIGYGTWLNSTAGATTIDVTMQNTSINSEYYPVYINQTGTLSGTFTNNTWSCSDDYVFYVDSGGTNGVLSLTGNQILGTDDIGIYLDQSAGSLTATIDNNLIIATDDYGIESSISGGSHFLTVNNNTIQSGDYCVYIDQTGGNTVNATITNNTLNVTADDYTVSYTCSAGTGSQVNISGNTALGNYEGFYIDQSSTANLDITFNNNYVIGSYYPLYLDISNGTTTLSMSGNTLNSSEAIYIEQSGGALNATISDNTLASNYYSTLFYTPAGASTATIDITGNTISGAAGTNAGGIFMDITSSDLVTTNITNNSFQATEYAVYAATASAGVPVINLSGNTVTNGGGFFLQSTADSTTWMVNNNSFTTLSTAPLTASASTTGSVCLQLNNNTAYPTADAYVLTKTGSGTFHLNPPQGNVGAISSSGVTTQACP